MMGAAALVTVGFVVKKRWKYMEGGKEKTKTKDVSQVFTSRSAAATFRDLAEKSYRANPVKDEFLVEFYVSDKDGKDGLPAGL
jgi:hypothetical protein